MARILLGMNGGTDSSVAAWMLKRDAHEVVGVTLRIHGLSVDDKMCAESARICMQLGIEHHVVDATALFNEKVLNPFVASCNQGVCPDLEAVCLSEVLFPALVQLRQRFDCSSIATGHYAQVKHGRSGIGLRPLQLHRAHDKFADQSYLLYGMSQDALNLTVLPLADYGKAEVRKEAMRSGLQRIVPLGSNKGMCFPLEGGFANFLEKTGQLTPVPGEIVALGTETVLGTHKGLYHYAFGQEVDVNGMGVALHVVAKDPATNRLYVGPSALSAVEERVVTNVNWTSIMPPEEKRSCRAKVSFGATPAPCQMTVLSPDKVHVAFNQPVEGIASGSPIVFYSDKLVLAGGLAE